jgi:hypothetical protein
MSKTDFRVDVNVEAGLGGVAFHLCFASYEDAVEEKRRITKAWLDYDEHRWNDPERRRITCKHDLGEDTIELNRIYGVCLFHAAEATEAGVEKRQKENEQLAACIVAAFKGAKDL